MKPILCLSEDTPAYQGPFFRNIKAFLKQYGKSVRVTGLRQLQVWLVTLRVGESTLHLHVYEEHIDDRNRVCDPCRCIGA